MLTYSDLKKKQYFEANKEYAAKHLGIRFIRGERAYCPFHEDSQDSFRIYIHENSGVRFRCWGACEGDWDIYDLIMRLEKCSFAEAQKRFAAYLDVSIELYRKYNNKEANSIDQQEPSQPVTQTTSEELTDRHRQVMLDAAQFYQQFLAEGNQSCEKALGYLSKRDVDSDTAHRFLIGYCPPFTDEGHKGRAFLNHIIPELDKEYRKHKEYLQTSLLRLLDDETSRAHSYYRNQLDFSAGFWSRYYADYFAGRITFPVFDYEGRIQGIIGRRPDNRKFAWMKQAGSEGVIRTKGWLYGIDKAARGIAQYQTVIVVEGIFDYFAFFNLAENPDRPIVVSCLGSRLDASAINLLQELGAKYFIVAFDCDDAGRRGIQKAVGDIKDGKVSYLGSLKEGEDPAVALKKISGGLSNFGMRHLQKGMEVRSPSGKPVMASIMVQRQKGEKIVPDEVLIKPVETINGKSAVAPQPSPTGTLYYKIVDLLPLLTYDHGNRAELDRKLDLIRRVLDSPVKEEPDTKKGWLTLPVKFIEDEILVKLGAAVILHLRLAMEQQQRKRKVKVSDSELAGWLNTSRKTIQKYKAELREAGLLNTKLKGIQQSLSVRYFSKADDQAVPVNVE